MNICAVQSFKPLLKFPGALCCTIETSIIHSTILNDSDVFKLMFSRTRDVRHVGILFSFWYKLDQVWTWSSFPLPPYLIPLRLVIFLLLFVCLLVGTKWQWANFLSSEWSNLVILRHLQNFLLTRLLNKRTNLDRDR